MWEPNFVRSCRAHFGFLKCLTSRSQTLQNYLIGLAGPPCTVNITFADGDTRKTTTVKKENGSTELVALFSGQETVAGEVSCG